MPLVEHQLFRPPSRAADGRHLEGTNAPFRADASRRWIEIPRDNHVLNVKLQQIPARSESSRTPYQACKRLQILWSDAISTFVSPPFHS